MTDPFMGFSHGSSRSVYRFQPYYGFWTTEGYIQKSIVLNYALKLTIKFWV